MHPYPAHDLNSIFLSPQVVFHHPAIYELPLVLLYESSSQVCGCRDMLLVLSYFPTLRGSELCLAI